jgi:hypothetical protein
MNPNKITPQLISQLNENEILVFESNTLGKHDRGISKLALTFGAEFGKGIGLSGNTYAIPIKGSDLKRYLNLSQIKGYVDKFIEFAKQNKELFFLITPIGSDFKTYSYKEIAPLFKETLNLENVSIPFEWYHYLNQKINHLQDQGSEDHHK